MAFGREKKSFEKKKKPKEGGRFGGRSRPKVCRMCTEQSVDLDYKNVRVLQGYLSDRGKIMPRRISGTCAQHQRDLTNAIKRARQIAYVPYTALHGK